MSEHEGVQMQLRSALGLLAEGAGFVSHHHEKHRYAMPAAVVSEVSSECNDPNLELRRLTWIHSC